MSIETSAALPPVIPALARRGQGARRTARRDIGQGGVKSAARGPSIDCRCAWATRTARCSAPPTPPCRPWMLHDPDRLARRIGPQRTDRFRRVLHGRRVDVGRSRRCADRIRDVDGRPGAPVTCNGCARSRWPVNRESQHNSRDQARRNISEHYDLSNELFAEFLDETMTYSSALFDQLPATPDRLADAQRRKIDRLLDCAGVRRRQPGCSRSAPAGANCACRRPPGVRTCSR